MNIAETRKKFPEYGALTDQQLASAIYEKHYTDQMSREEFFERVGIEAPAPPPSEDSRGQNVLDVLGEFAAAVNRSVTEFLDLAPESAEYLLHKAGIDVQLPELTELFARATTGNFMEPGLPRSIVRQGGEILPAGLAGAVPVAGRNVATAGGAAAEFLGAGTAKAPQGFQPAASALADKLSKVRPGAAALAVPGAVVGSAVPGAGDVARTSGAEALRHITPGQRAARAAADVPVKRGTGDVEAAGYKLNPADPEGPPIIDSKAHATMGQGFDPGFIAMLKAQDRQTKDQILKILRTAQKGQKNFEYRARNRPLNVVGQSLLDRINVVKKAKSEAGKDVGRTAQALKGQVVDPAPAVNGFIGNLQDMGVKYDPATAQFDFSQSDIRGLPKLQAPIKRIIKIMQDYPPGQMPDAHEIHTLKRIIDAGVNYAKQKQGLGGNAERVLKKLRRDLDGLLDGFSPEYDDANKRFSSAIDALNQMQDAVGRKIDFTSPNAASALGTKARTLASNYTTRVPLTDAIESMDGVVAQYATPSGKNLLEGPNVTRNMLTDNLIPQVEAISQLERVIGTAATNSFFGDIEKAAQRATEAAGGSFGGLVTDTAKAASRKLKGQNEDRAIEYLIDLLED